MKSLFRRSSRNRVGRLMSHAVKHTPGLRFCSYRMIGSFEAEKRIFQSGRVVGGVQFHGAFEMFAGDTVFPNLQARVCRVFMNGGAVGLQDQSFFEAGDGLVISASLQSLVSAGQQFIAG